MTPQEQRNRLNDIMFHAQRTEAEYGAVPAPAVKNVTATPMAITRTTTAPIAMICIQSIFLISSILQSVSFFRDSTPCFVFRRPYGFAFCSVCGNRRTQMVELVINNSGWASGCSWGSGGIFSSGSVSGS